MFRLVVSAGPDRGKSLLLRRGRYSVGKAPDCDLVMTDAAVSRRHLVLKVLEDGVEALDVGSKNGSFFHGARFRQLTLGGGAVLSIGASQLVMAAAGRRATDPPASQANRFGTLLGGSLVMRRLFALLARVAQNDGPVLIEGETGTGKEVCAESLHAAGSRPRGPFVVCDLSGDRDHQDAFAAAAGGTLFIDDIGELGLEAQPRLLRALERREYKPIGASDYRPLDARVIASTNRDLWEECKAHRFRADLYHRLAVLRVRIPPLRDRTEDIPLLAREFLGLRAQALTGDAWSLLAAHSWPGNVRELRNILTQATSLVPEGRSLGATEIGLMQRAGGNVARAAKQAGIDRPYLYRLLRKHGLGPAEDES